MVKTIVGGRVVYPVTRHFSHNLVFYRGPSALTGDPILGIAGQATSNPKTGSVVQIWVLRSDVSPIEAVKTGGDDAICGGCRHRGDGLGNARSCYVEYFRAPFNLWRGLPNTQQDVTIGEVAERLAGKHVRLTAYGDPAALPFDICEALLKHASGWTAYTHQWRTCDRRFQHIAMASVDSLAEHREATRQGWRTFRVRRADQIVIPAEVVCPASEEAGHRTQCAECGLCCGTSRSAKSVSIIAHGSNATHFQNPIGADGSMSPAADASQALLLRMCGNNTALSPSHGDSR
jgi:hypothetical protein